MTDICACFVLFFLMLPVQAVVYMAKVLHGFLKMAVDGAALTRMQPINVHLRLDQSQYACHENSV